LENASWQKGYGKDYEQSLWVVILASAFQGTVARPKLLSDNDE